MTHSPEVMRFLGKNVSVVYRDMDGDLHTRSTHVYDIASSPGRGARVICEGEDIWLDAVISITPLD